MKTNHIYLHNPNNIVFSYYFNIYNKNLKKENSAKWTVSDFKDFAEFLEKKRENYNSLKLKLFGDKKATDKDLLLFEKKLIEKKLITTNN